MSDLERDFHRWLNSIQNSDVTTGRADGRSIPLGLEVGIGDDAAILSLLNRGTFPQSSNGVAETVGGLVMTTDTIAEGTHFTLPEHSLSQIGRKAMGVNLSDIAAMGASPVAAMLSLVVPSEFGIVELQQIVQGATELAAKYSVPLIGGDTNRWNGRLVVGVTVVGWVEPRGAGDGTRGWRMSGARPGDVILVTGQFGGSILGHHMSFQPRVKLAQQLNARYDIHAATDVSDSLSLDLSLMANASRERTGLEIGIELKKEAIPWGTDAQKMGVNSGKSPVEHALTDGEDFELALAVSADTAHRILNDDDLDLSEGNDQDRNARSRITLIGQFIDRPGFFLVSEGVRTPFAPKGYSH